MSDRGSTAEPKQRCLVPTWSDSTTGLSDEIAAMRLSGKKGTDKASIRSDRASPGKSSRSAPPQLSQELAASETSIGQGSPEKRTLKVSDVSSPAQKRDREVCKEAVTTPPNRRPPVTTPVRPTKSKKRRITELEEESPIPAKSRCALRRRLTPEVLEEHDMSYRTPESALCPRRCKRN